jgi:hypothetical protein
MARAPEKRVEDDLAVVLSSLYTREQYEEIVRLLRERNRLLERQIDALKRGRDDRGPMA